MTPEAFAEDFHILADAPNGVPKLREMVLELAVRGKLVGQDAKDEPASVLLKKIKEEREKLVNEGKIRKQKSLPPIQSNEVPFELPDGWKWVRLGELIRVSSGTGLTSRNMEAGEIPVFGGNGITGYHNCFNVDRPTVVIGRVGFYCGSIHLTPEKAWVTDNAFITMFFDKWLFLPFLVWLLRATDLKQNDSATAQPVISGRKIYPLLVQLPPLAEQKRIVARIEKLLVLCDELEAHQEKRAESRVIVNGACLNALTSPDGDSAEIAWKRISKNFDLLYDCPENVNALRQAILQLAVQGRLVPQDPSDEPASVLVEKIGVEKERLVKEGKIKKQKPLPPIETEGVPYDLPAGWVWIRLLNAAIKITDGEHLSPRKTDSGVLLLTAKHVTESGVLLEDPQFVSLDDAVRFRVRCDPEIGDILICSRGTIGRCTVVNVGEYFCLMGSVILVKPSRNVIPKYLTFGMRTDWGQKWMLTSSGATAVKALYLKDIKNCPVALPPVAEQKRIVAKVDQLMTLCDVLETKLKRSESSAEIVMNAVVHELTRA